MPQSHEQFSPDLTTRFAQRHGQFSFAERRNLLRSATQREQAAPVLDSFFFGQHSLISRRDAARRVSFATCKTA
jgi:hypothetical protein